MNAAVAGAILAGGRSARLRSDDGRLKPDIELADGRAMIEHVHDAVAPRCAQVVILGDCCALPNVPRIADQRPGCGPLGGIEALLDSGLGEYYLIVPCDLPHITTEALGLLLEECDARAVVFDTRAHPLPARLCAGVLPIVRELLDVGERRVWQLMTRLVAHEVALPRTFESQLRNINTPDDLRALADAG